MGKHRIRITGSGIHGAPTPENPTGEIPVGTEFDTDADLPAGWVGRAVIVGDEPKSDATFVVAEDDGTEEGRIRNQIGKQAQAEIDRARNEGAEALRVATARADRAEADLADARKQLDALTQRQAGETGASADDIASAVGMLDGATDAHWTAAGLPAVDAVSDLLGKPVTRAAIAEAAPDAKRPTA